MEALHSLLAEIVDLAIIVFELMGVGVLIISGIRGIYSYFTRNPLTRLNLAKGMAMGLEFKLGSEILRTVIVRDFSEILTVAGIIILRATLTFLIHWEIKNEEANHDLHETIRDDDVAVGKKEENVTNQKVIKLDKLSLK
ncbi:hypothetical protein acsn021_34300 [Anaerocolumna cellulosilytica]|uniref:Uncharacterized protein n=1 Tax=Anaerocolumna cellulosilytica TaxID=433286 RepID=A0A6S6RAI0_9FIRM|nr:DUF1622 domain-containing protein [Anaerocolumna cellulosilytica]MBB5196745.1 putative membrane protein [Anaerocolumna cellulosilytica]BCJ95861.1 hypothetical protein acsn021_34300 [Anaerocolumna cellulosilytica]